MESQFLPPIWSWTILQSFLSKGKGTPSISALDFPTLPPPWRLALRIASFLLASPNLHPNSLLHLDIPSLNPASFFSDFPTSFFFFRKTGRKSGLLLFKGQLLKGDLQLPPLIQWRAWPMPHINCSQKGWQRFLDARSNGQVSSNTICLTATFHYWALFLKCSLGFHDTTHPIFLRPLQWVLPLRASFASLLFRTQALAFASVCLHTDFTAFLYGNDSWINIPALVSWTQDHHL